ncbi:MAG: DUF1232 domain-containing protein [Actinomycetota bacterium]
MRTILLALAIAVAVWLAVIAALALAGRRTAARELATLVPNLLLLFRDLLRDRRVPRSAKVVLAVAVVWLVSPIDLVPEFVPVLGPLDDAVVAALALGFLLRRSGPEIIAEHWRGSAGTLGRILHPFRRTGTG